MTTVKAVKHKKWTVTVWRSDDAVKRYSVIAVDEERAVAWVLNQHLYSADTKVAVCQDAALIGERVLTRGGLAAIISDEWTRQLDRLISDE